MSENRVRKAFRTTKIKITKDNVPSQEQRDALDSLFLTLEATKTDAVAAERHAAIATAKAKSKGAAAMTAEVEFLIRAADHFPQVAGDRIWMVYRDKEGSIILEGFTERLFRNNMRAQQDNLGSQIANSGDDSIDRSGLYEVDDAADAENDIQGADDEESAS